MNQPTTQLTAGAGHAGTRDGAWLAGARTARLLAWVSLAWMTLEGAAGPDEAHRTEGERVFAVDLGVLADVTGSVSGGFGPSAATPRNRRRRKHGRHVMVMIAGV